jgi:hypothetical protein
MKSKTSLFDDEEINLYDFSLIGISCHLKDYELCWNINKRLSFNFIKQRQDIEISVKKTISKHPFYTFATEDGFVSYTLIKNRTTGLMVPEQPNADYFLKIEGDVSSHNLVSSLKNVPGILTAFVVDVNKLKSKENFLF